MNNKGREGEKKGVVGRHKEHWIKPCKIGDV